MTLWLACVFSVVAFSVSFKTSRIWWNTSGVDEDKQQTGCIINTDSNTGVVVGRKGRTRVGR